MKLSIYVLIRIANKNSSRTADMLIIVLIYIYY